MPSPVALPIAEVALQSRVEPRAPLGIPPSRQMLHQIEGEAADQVHAQQLGAERAGELRPPGVAGPVAHPELAVAVDRGRAHEVSDRAQERRIRLAALRQAVDHVGEEPHALVRAAQHELRGQVSARLLSRRLRRQAPDVGLGRHAVEQGERRVPRFGDHPVGAPLRLQVVGKADQAVLPVRRRHRVDGGTVPFAVEVEPRRLDPPALPVHEADQAAHEAEPRRKGGPHAHKPHDGVRRSRGGSTLGRVHVHTGRIHESERTLFPWNQCAGLIVFLLPDSRTCARTCVSGVQAQGLDERRKDGCGAGARRHPEVTAQGSRRWRRGR